MKSRDSSTREVGRLAPEQLAHRAAPEDAADHRGGLQCRLLDGRQQVDARGEHRVDRVGDISFGIADVALERGREQLLQEERVALGRASTS